MWSTHEKAPSPSARENAWAFRISTPIKLLRTLERRKGAQRDPQRFGELYERNFDRVYAYVTRRVADHASAEDITSEVFQKALADIRRFEWGGVPFIARLSGWQRTLSPIAVGA